MVRQGLDGKRRGVLMTASARKPRASWRDLPEEEDRNEGSDSGEEKVAAKTSQNEWEKITREVREEKAKRFAETEFAMGKRDVVAGYDDVAEDAIEPDRPPVQAEPDEPSGDAAASAPDTSASASASISAPRDGAVAESARLGSSSEVRASATEDAGSPPRMSTDAANTAGARGADAAASADADRELPPEGAITAGQVETAEAAAARKKRGGKRKTGSQKKRDRAEADGEAFEGHPGKRRKKDEDEDDGKWIKLKLDGEEKSKRIKASRIVHYYDHDSAGKLFREEAADPAASSSAAASSDPAPSVASSTPQAPAASATTAAPPAAAQGNFRAGLRWDLWDDDSDE